MARVRIENVVKKFAGGVTALNNVSLEIPDGKFVVLVGPSGCGKTTLLRLIAGLESAAGGRILIGDKDVTDFHPRDRDIAMVFQSYALYPHMSVKRNMGFALELKEVPQAQVDERIRKTATILGITELLNRRPKQLSGGQRQRVALGRAIVREPSVFLFDEPLSNLDAKLRTAMRSELIKLHKRLATTVVYVTHDQVEAMTMGQMVVVMKEGVVQQVGSPLEIYRDPKNLFVAGFIGSPSMNFLPAKLQRQGEHVSAQVGGMTISLPDKSISQMNAGATDVILGIRPEHLSLAAVDKPVGQRVMIDGLVEVVETLGAETIMEIKVGDRVVVARQMGEDFPEVGAGVRLWAESRQFFVFDASSGKRLAFSET